MVIGVMACLNDEISPAIAVHPNSPSIIIPGSALHATGPGVLFYQPDVTMGINPAHLVLMLPAFAGDGLICNNRC
jgi:hypothetical protein